MKIKKITFTGVIRNARKINEIIDYLNDLPSHTIYNKSLTALQVLRLKEIDMETKLKELRKRIREIEEFY